MSRMTKVSNTELAGPWHHRGATARHRKMLALLIFLPKMLPIGIRLEVKCKDILPSVATSQRHD